MHTATTLAAMGMPKTVRPTVRIEAARKSRGRAYIAYAAYVTYAVNYYFYSC